MSAESDAAAPAASQAAPAADSAPELPAETQEDNTAAPAESETPKKPEDGEGEVKSGGGDDDDDDAAAAAAAKKDDDSAADAEPSTPKADAELQGDDDDAAAAATDGDDASSAAAAAAEPSSSSAASYKGVKDVGVATEKNPRFRRTMEDEHKFVDSFAGEETSSYAAVYDGHGGRAVVEYVEQHLHVTLAKLLEEGKLTPGDALKESYLETDRGLAEAGIQFSGTTSISVLIRKNPADGKKTLFSANAGDARTVLCRDGTAVRLTHDHKGTDPDEQARITEAGGFVVLNRVNGVLAVTRALGDITMKEYVTGEPYQTETILEDTDHTVILACDGLWDVCEDQQACDLIKDIPSAQDAADLLLKHALTAGSTDNISIIVVRL